MLYEVNDSAREILLGFRINLARRKDSPDILYEGLLRDVIRDDDVGDFHFRNSSLSGLGHHLFPFFGMTHDIDSLIRYSSLIQELQEAMAIGT